MKHMLLFASLVLASLPLSAVAQEKPEAKCLVTTDIPELTAAGDALQRACGEGMKSVSITGTHEAAVYEITYESDLAAMGESSARGAMALGSSLEMARQIRKIINGIFPVRTLTVTVRDGDGVKRSTFVFEGESEEPVTGGDLRSLQGAPIVIPAPRCTATLKVPDFPASDIEKFQKVCGGEKSNIRSVTFSGDHTAATFEVVYNLDFTGLQMAGTVLFDQAREVALFTRKTIMSVYPTRHFALTWLDKNSSPVCAFVFSDDNVEFDTGGCSRVIGKKPAPQHKHPSTGVVAP